MAAPADPARNFARRIMPRSALEKMHGAMAMSSPETAPPNAFFPDTAAARESVTATIQQPEGVDLCPHFRFWTESMRLSQ